MWEIEESLVVELPVPVPIAAPADPNSHFGRNAQDKSSKTVKCFPIVPADVRGFWKPGDNVGSPGGFFVMSAVGVFKLGAAFVECLVLLLFLSAPGDYGTIPVLDYFVKKELQIGVALY